MPAATKPIQTSAPQIKGLLAKAGRFLLMSEHYDKLDAFVELVDQINDKLNHKVKMDLKLSDLNSFLSREGMTEEPDLKGCISKVIQLVHMQRERLGQYAGAQADGKKKENTEKILDDLLKLWGMDNQQVEECFAIEVYSSPVSTEQKHGHVPSGESKAQQQSDEDRLAGGRKHDRAFETADSLVTPEVLSSEQHQDSAPESQNPPVERMAKRQPSDSLVTPEVLSSEQHQDSAPESQNPHVERMAKRQRSGDQLGETLMIVPRRARLVEDLRRLVPASILAIEDENNEATSADRQSLARAEVDRILQADLEGTAILLGDSAEKRRESFRNIVRLLHPDVGLVSIDDARAMKALDLSLTSFMKSELRAED